MKTNGSSAKNGEIKLKKKWKIAEDLKPQWHNNQLVSQWKDGTEKDLRCYSCGLQGHYSSQCNQRDHSLSAAPMYVTCFHCGLLGHYSSKCNQRGHSLTARPGSSNGNQQVILISKDRSLKLNAYQKNTENKFIKDKINGIITCMVCGIEGHYTCECPMKDQVDKVICTLCSKGGHCYLWCCQQNTSMNHACTRCGELGHVDSKYGVNCSSCDEYHPYGKCEMSKVTCFVCEGHDHCPAQCPLDSVLTTVLQNQRENFRDALRLALSRESSKITTPTKLSKESVVCDPSTDEKSSGRNSSAVKCFSCGEKGHRAKSCHSTPAQASTKLCYNCGEKGHLDKQCCQKLGPSVGPASSKEGRTVAAPANLPNELEARHPGTTKQSSAMKPASSNGCYRCGEEGHWARSCPSKQQISTPRKCKSSLLVTGDRAAKRAKQ